ncbi:hypothetical protein ASC77_23650 [Nocardioides sp. Root1257]|nr:hypothetical protein ASC77_23650 [Nocardioides sp. Root1257]KRC39915.1 hypothetical protein ASE24_23445 [Nocardioides sp. Root224]
MAVSAAMARGAEQMIDLAPGFQPVRWTADLFRPVPMRPCSVRVEVLRSGRRLTLAEVELVQEDQVMARARALFIAGAEAAEEAAWQPERQVAVPPVELEPNAPENRLYFSENEGWSTYAAAHSNLSRKQIWHFPFSVIENETPSPFQLAAGVADMASVVSHWGSDGVPYINADITLAMARPPTGLMIGAAGLERVASDGIAVGTALMHDRAGVFGTATVCGLWNGDRRVNPAGRDERPEIGT